MTTVVATMDRPTTETPKPPDAPIRFLGDGLPLKSRTLATYHGSQEEWLRLAEALDRPGGRRVAAAIRAGVQRSRWKDYGYVPLRFADGSISVIDEAIAQLGRGLDGGGS